MYVVVIHSWPELSPDLAQALAETLGVTIFDAKQRLLGTETTVVANFAEPGPAQKLLSKLQTVGFKGFIIDAAVIRSKNTFLNVHRFELGDHVFGIEDDEGGKEEVGYNKIDLLLPATRVIGRSETNTVTERKFSLGKTLLSGGVPMTKKVKHQEVVSVEDRERVLYLCAGIRLRVICAQSSLSYDGLGAGMKPSQEMNFNFLVSDLRRRCPHAVYDECLLKRTGQAKLLGPTLNPDTHMELAVDILARKNLGD